jgi:aminoglycoside 6'-N-acetyltransferase
VGLRGALTVVRPATEADVELLVAWHADPEVSRYWDDETYTAAEIRERLDRTEVDPWIVEADGNPVGYLQSYPHGLDGFLVPEARGRRLMPDAARTLATHLIDSGWPEVIVDPYEWNEQALRGWANAGFVEASRHEPDDEHRHRWVLMRFAR